MLVKYPKIIEIYRRYWETKLNSQKIIFIEADVKLLKQTGIIEAAGFCWIFPCGVILAFRKKCLSCCFFCCCEFIQSFKLRTLAILKLVQKIDMQHWLATSQGEFQHSISTRFCWNLIKSVLKCISTQMLKNFNKTSISTLSPFFNNCVESFQ